MLLPIFILAMGVVSVSVMQNKVSETNLEGYSSVEREFYNRGEKDQKISQLNESVSVVEIKSAFKDMVFLRRSCHTGLALLQQCRQSYTLNNIALLPADSVTFCNSFYDYFAKKNHELGRDEFSPTEDDLKELLMIDIAPTQTNAAGEDILTDIYSNNVVLPLGGATATTFVATLKSNSFKDIRSSLPNVSDLVDAHLSNSISVNFTDPQTNHVNLFSGLDVKFHSIAQNGGDKIQDAILSYYQSVIPKLSRVRKYLNEGLSSDGMSRVFFQANRALEAGATLANGAIVANTVYEVEFLDTYLRYRAQLNVMGIGDTSFGIVGANATMTIETLEALDRVGLSAQMGSVPADFTTNMTIHGYRMNNVDRPNQDENGVKQGVQNISMCDMEKIVSHKNID